MPPIRFDIWWSETDHKTFKADSEQSVGEVVSEIKEHLGDRLSESDQANNIIEYTLFKEVQGHREPLLARKRTLSQARIVEGELLYLANLHTPWWQQPQTALSQPHPTPHAPQTPLAQPWTCQLQLSIGYSIAVPQAGVQLSRSYLLAVLPPQIVALEQAKSFAGLKSRLQAVSRQPHCEIVPQGAQWLLRAYAYTYLNGRSLSKGMTTLLSHSSRMVLGRDGWPIEVQLLSA